MRFAREIRELAARLTLDGVIVLAPGEIALVHGTGPTDEQKESLDALHRSKIDLADRVVVVNPGGYVGDATRGEIAHARSMGKPVCFTEPCP